MKYLAKFGFEKGGALGKSGIGISQPIIVQKRSDVKKGLQEGGELLARRDMGALEFEQQSRLMRGEAVDSDAEEFDSDEGAGESGWRVAGPAKPKRRRVYKTAEEVLAEAGAGSGGRGGAGAGGVGPILDMRGPSSKVLTSLKGLDADGDADVQAQLRQARQDAEAEALRKTVGKELLHNTRQLLDLSEMNLFTLKSKVDKESNAVAALEADLKGVEERRVVNESRVTALTTVMELVTRATAGASDGSLSLTDAAEVLEAIQRDHPPAVLRSLRLEQLGPALLKAVLQPITRGARRGVDLDVSVFAGVERFRPLVPSDAYHDALATVVQGITQRLVPVIRGIVIDPSNQSLDAWNQVMKWGTILPEPHLATLLEGEFLPQWYHVLATWLSRPNASLAEVKRWYCGWRSLLGKKLLADQGVARQLHRALDLVAKVATASSAAAGAAVAAAARASSVPGVRTDSYYRSAHARSQESSLEQQRAAHAQQQSLYQHQQTADAARRQEQRRQHAAMYRPAMTFREALETLCANAGLSLLPHPTRPSHAGNKLYSLSGVTLYVSNDVTFAETDAKAHRFQPMSLDNVFAMAKRG